MLHIRRLHIENDREFAVMVKLYDYMLEEMEQRLFGPEERVTFETLAKDLRRYFNAHRMRLERLYPDLERTLPR